MISFHASLKKALITQAELSSASTLYPRGAPISCGEIAQKHLKIYFSCFDKLVRDYKAHIPKAKRDGEKIVNL